MTTSVAEWRYRTAVFATDLELWADRLSFAAAQVLEDCTERDARRVVQEMLRDLRDQSHDMVEWLGGGDDAAT